MEENKELESSGKKKLKKSSIVGYIVSILCLLLCLYITVEVINANTHNRPPRIFGVSVSYVPTASMEPTISAKSYVLFTKADTDKIEAGQGDQSENHDNRQGDIIVYYSESEAKFIIHRVVEVGEDSEGKYFILWGDNNLVADKDKVRENMVYGKYVTTLGFMNVLSGGINTNLIFYILVGIFVIMIGMQVAQIVIKSKTDEIKQKQIDEKNALREELKRQILREEIAKLKSQNSAVSSKEDNSESSEETEVIENKNEEE